MDRIQKLIEEHVGWLIVLTLLVVSVAGLVEILPLAFQKSVTEPVAGVKRSPPCSWRAATSTSARAAPPATPR